MHTLKYQGTFQGWKGETIVKLANGQIWKQAEYSYTYSYEYSPSVAIFGFDSGYAMQVEDTEETVRVSRLK